MRSTTRLAFLLAALCAACANKAAPSTPAQPVAKFVFGTAADPLQVVAIEPQNPRANQQWNIRSDFRGLPPALHNDHTAAVIRSSRGHIVYMDQPLCQASPTLYVNFAGHERWGRALYENFNRHRSVLLQETRALVESNCPPGVVQTVNLAAFVRTPIWSREDMRYLDRYDAKREGTDAGRFVYFGVIQPGNAYTLVHHDDNGLARYLRTNHAHEASMARVEARQEAERRLQREGLGVIFTDYCSAHPAACAGFVLMMLKAAGSGGAAAPGSNDFRSCLAQCQLQPVRDNLCSARCYENIAR